MQLVRVAIRDTRNLEHIDIALGPGINYLVGQNGAGKTSILEGINILSTGVSFRSRSADKLIRHGAPTLQVFAEYVSRRDSHAHTIGVQRARSGNTRVRIDGENATRLSDLTQRLPIIALHPESHQLVMGGPSLRRKLIDWGVFHVEHSFLETWKDYRRALDQRNAALKQGAENSAILVWDETLAENGEKLHQKRERYLEHLLPFINRYLSTIEWGSGVTISLRRGWPEDVSLKEELQQSFNRDRTYRTTHPGPHRAELLIKHNDVEIRNTFSRGQQKLLVYLLRIAQADHIAGIRDVRSVFLCDDLPAELDREKRLLICRQLLESGYQVFATSVENLVDEFKELDSKVFHVEHGTVLPVV